MGLPHYRQRDPSPRTSSFNRVTVVDVEKDVAVGEIANTPGVHGVALVPKLHLGFISVGGDNTVAVFDLATLKEVERIKVGSRPDVIDLRSRVRPSIRVQRGQQ